MPTTRGAAKRAQAGSSAAAAEGSKRAKRGEKPAQAGPSEPKKAAKPALTEAQRKHKSRQLETNEVYEKKDWDEVVEQVETKFRSNPNLGRLELSFNFHVRKWAAKIPKDVAKKHLAPLTQLTRLSFGGYYMADADPLPAGAALPHLKIAGMGEANLCMETLGPFMPNVEQLRAQRIQIHLQPVAHGAASSSSGSSGSYHPGVCKALTHLSCQHLWVYGPSSKEATGAAVAAAFPALRVITQAPTVTGFPDERTFSMNSVRTSRSGSTMYITPAMRSERFFIYDYPRYLKHLKALSVSGTDGALYDRYSAKDLGSARTLARTDWGYKPLAGVTSLRVLWIKEIKKSDLRLACEVSSLQQLTQFCFTLSKPVITADVHKLLQSLLHLTKLSTLAMPIHLLCTEGCAAGISTATVSSTLGQIAALPSLKHLILLDDHHESPRWTTDWEDYGKESAEGQPQKCNHRASWLEAIPKLTPAAAAAAGASTASSKGLEVLLVDTNGDFRSSSEYDWGHPLWGVFGPPDQYFAKLEW